MSSTVSPIAPPADWSQPVNVFVRAVGFPSSFGFPNGLSDRGVPGPAPVFLMVLSFAFASFSPGQPGGSVGAIARVAGLWPKEAATGDAKARPIN